MSNFQPIVSSNLEAAAFEDGAILVRFKGGNTYRYPNCTDAEWRRFEATFDGRQGRSAGKHLNKYLRPKPYERVED